MAVSMTTSHITQCPHCRTAFRVSDEQLSAAKGAVRCGSCLKVFRADEHLRDNNPNPPMRATETTVKSPARAMNDQPVKPLPATAAQTAPDKPGVASRAASQAAPAATNAAALASASPAWDVGSEFAADDEDLLFSEDSLAADDDDIIFMDDDQDLDDDIDEGDGELEFSDSFLALNDNELAAASASLEQQPTRTSSRKSQPELDEEAWSRDLLAEPAPAKTAPPAKKKTIQPLDDLSFSLDDADDNEPAGSKPRGSFAHHDLDEMVERMEQPRAAIGLWALAAVALMAVLAGQILWWQRAQLAQYPSLAPVYAQLCQHVPCNLAEPVPDASALRPISSVLREMPNQRMRLDAVLINRGARALPFPNVLLVITDAQGDIVADGLFKPADYISGDFRPDDLVPPGQPISISINTNRPVDNLDNFRLTFQY